MFLQVMNGHTWPGHGGGGANLPGGEFDLTWGYDPASAPQSLQSWVETSDPISILLRESDKSGAVPRAVAEALDSEVRAEAQAAGRFALESPFPPPEGALDHVLGRVSHA